MMKQLCVDFDPAPFLLMRWNNDVKKGRKRLLFEGWQVMSAKVKRENSAIFKMYCGRCSWTTCCLHCRSTSSSFGRSFLDHGSWSEGRFGVMFITVTALSRIIFVGSSRAESVWTFFVHRGDTHHFWYFGRRVSGRHLHDDTHCLPGGTSVSAPCCHESFRLMARSSKTNLVPSIVYGVTWFA